MCNSCYDQAESQGGTHHQELWTTRQGGVIGVADDDDKEDNMQEYVFQKLRATMADTRKRGKIFLAICGVPVAANEANMMMAAIDDFLYPKSKS